jgi:hypothetical protein
MSSACMGRSPHLSKPALRRPVPTPHLGGGQDHILAAMLLNPDAEYSLRELAQRFRAHEYGPRRSETPDRRGLLLRREAGRSAMVRANRVTACFKLLAKLLPSGPLLQVVAAEFSGNGQSPNGR